MAQTWPPALSNYVLHDGYSESPPDNALRTEMDDGPVKTRRKSIAARRPIQVKKHMYKTEVATFDTFYDTTCVNGTLSFDWVHPRTGSVVEMMFTSPPVYESLGGTAWMVSMNLEILP